MNKVTQGSIDFYSVTEKLQVLAIQKDGLKHVFQVITLHMFDNIHTVSS